MNESQERFCGDRALLSLDWWWMHKLTQVTKLQRRTEHKQDMSDSAGDEMTGWYPCHYAGVIPTGVFQDVTVEGNCIKIKENPLC